jgi:hypothetical protein
MHATSRGVIVARWDIDRLRLKPSYLERDYP